MHDDGPLGPAVIELESGSEGDDVLVGRDRVSRRLLVAHAEAGLLVDRDPFAARLLERADDGLDRWQVLVLRWRFRVGWPVTAERSRVARLSDLGADEAVAALSTPGHLTLGGAHLRWGPPGPGRRAARELVAADGTCRLRWSWPELPVSVAVAEWSGRRCQLTLRIRPSARVRWPRRWYEIAHLFLIDLDRHLAARVRDAAAS
jgi:hypothetical protein